MFTKGFAAVTASLFSLSALAADDLLLRKTYSHVLSGPQKSRVYAKTCEYFDDHMSVTVSTGDESSTRVEPANYEVPVLRSLIDGASREKVVKEVNRTCGMSSTFHLAFLDGNDLLIEELVECNSHGAIRKGAATQELVRFMHRTCPDFK